MEKGDFHSYHNHSALIDQNFISGAYYLNPGDSGDCGGNFRALVNPQIIQHTESKSYQIMPQKDLKLMFPANLFHEVTPYTGVKKRIMVSFNICSRFK